MSARKFEEDHGKRIKELLAKSGLVCVKPPPDVSESSSYSESVEHERIEEQRELEESVKGSLEEIAELGIESEESPVIFPTPSLRRCLPQHIREIEEFNRIHVLPNTFTTDFDAIDIPIIKQTPPQIVIDVLGMLTGCTEYKSSLAEFWFLDTLANLLRRAQEDLIDQPSQAILVAWFCEWMKEMQHFDAADRQRMIRRFQDNIISAAQFVVDHHRLPTPMEVGVFYEAQEGGTPVVETSASVTTATDYQCALIDLTNIAHYIYDLFSTDYQYELVRSVFTFTPEYTLTNVPYQMTIPKRLYVPKPKPKGTSPKKEKEKPTQKKKEVENDDYTELLELQARERLELEEKEQQEREEWDLRSAILSLGFAATDEMYNTLWSIGSEQVDSEPKDKGKGKDKKK